MVSRDDSGPDPTLKLSREPKLLLPGFLFLPKIEALNRKPEETAS